MKSSLGQKRSCGQHLARGLAVWALVALAGCGSKQIDTAGGAQLQQELEQLRATNHELQQLRSENQELPRLLKDNQEVQRLREQTKDLARLRETNAQLRGELQALKAPKPK